ncbi:MAG TPA: DUF6457 domain-containing protein [Solirubrobacterales bacterium]
MAPEERQMTAEEWVERFAEELGAEPPGEAEFAQILELAAEAAHSSERTAAPVACWMAGRMGRPLGELLEVAARTSED